jgi:hypothetical protein
MTDEQINTAIAEHCGWKNLHKIPQIASLHSGWSGIKPDTGNDEFIPDYCNDLNAMHEAEKELYANECSMYFRILSKVHPTFGILPEWMDIDHEEEQAWEYFQLLHTTASQRAEAFVKTINKWEDS